MDAWCQCATLLTVDELVAAGDFLLAGPDAYRAGAPPATHEDLTRAVDAAASRPGVRRLRTALTYVRPNVFSPKETELRLVIIRAGLPEPIPNFRVRCADGVVRMLDLAYPELRLGLEYEGDGHRADRAVFLKDIERRELFQDIDWDIIRVTNSHLAPGAQPQLCARIGRRIAARRAHAR